MISQADIIKTLVNKNCTDESIMSIALSPDCMPSKLLEKLTEAERFDLALDFSMKLGLDVILLWKTWAMRCLRSRNFKEAREKFRRCFIRMRSPGGRISPAQSHLLEEILAELTRMDENQLPLAEEVELIKKRKPMTITSLVVEKEQQLSSPYAHTHKTSSQPRSVISKPAINVECAYYLNEYGTVQDRVKFYINNSLYQDAVDALLHKSSQVNLDKFFIGEIVRYCIFRGHFNNLVEVFLRSDPDVTISAKHFKAILDFCSLNRSYNLLYYVQSTIGDYIAAANTQINFFFLRKPLSNYQELNQRLNSLSNARNDYEKYLNKIKVKQQRQQARQPIRTNEPNPLFSQMLVTDVKKQLKLLDHQIDITRNFAATQVSGCMNGIELKIETSVEEKTNLDVADESPVTLFEKSKDSKTFLAGLVLIYFDLSCNSYFSKDGLDLANQLIDDHRLDKLRVFKTAMRIMIKDESQNPKKILDNASLLLERLKEDFYSSFENRKLQWGDLHLHPHLQSKKLDSSASATAKPVAVVRKKGDSSSHRIRSLNVDNKFKARTSLSDVSYASASGSVGSSTLRGSLDLQTTASSSSSSPSSPTLSTTTTTSSSSKPSLKSSSMSPAEQVQAICDEVIKDSIGVCNEPDYKMELAKLLSFEAKIAFYIENGKLNDAQRLACNMNRPDYVLSVIEEAAKLNQNHVKTVCEVWLTERRRG